MTSWPYSSSVRTTTTATTVTSLVVVITNYLVVGASPISQSHVNLALNSHVVVITTDLPVGTVNALALFTTTCEPGFMVTCNLYFFMVYIPLRNETIFISWFSSFYWCCIHRHINVMHVMCKTQRALPTLFSTKHKFYKRAFSCKFLWGTIFVSNIFS